MLRPNLEKVDVHLAGNLGSTKKDLAKILDTFYLYTDKEEQSVGRHLSNDGYWESWITSWMTKNISVGDVCIDVGANYGYYTRIMEYLSGKSGKVYAIEANPELCVLIDKAIKDHPSEMAEVILLNIAASDKDDDVILSVPSERIGGSTILSNRDELPSDIPDHLWDKEILVKASKLDDRIDEEHINLIKFDIEGAEPLAWAGMKNILNKTDIVIIEITRYTPDWLLDEMYSDWQVSFVDLEGYEQEISKDQIKQLDDLVMLVLRKPHN